MDDGGAADGSVHVLYVDGDTGRCEEAADSLAAADGRFQVTGVDGVASASSALASDRIDCVVSTADLADGDPLVLLEEARAVDLEVPLVLFVSDGSEALAAAAASRDVADYVRANGQDDRYERLAASVASAVDARRGGRERELFESLAASARTGLVAVDGARRIACANEACARLLGTTREALEGASVDETPLADAVPGDAVEPTGSDPDETMAVEGGNGETVTSERGDGETVTVEGDGGETTTIEVRVAPATVSGGQYTVLTCVDVTERVEYERESNILDAIFESIPVYLYIKDEEARHVRVSAVNEEAEDYLGKTDLDIWGESARENYEEDLRVIEEGEEIMQKEEHDPAWNHFYLTSKVPWRDENGEIRGLIGVTHDLSEWKRHEKQLERQNDRLRTVASVLSHDIRNPLQVAKGRLGLAREEFESDNLDASAQALERMADLLEELLAMVRHGQWVEEPEEVSLESVARGCWDTATSEDATLEFEFDLTLAADPGRFQQLLENLFRNAVVHGGDDVHVKVGPLDSWAGFYVEDDGPGIPEDEREKVFESGYTTADVGTGFGLAIVEVIAEAHGWGVEVTDSDEGGARFEFAGVEFV